MAARCAAESHGPYQESLSGARRSALYCWSPSERLRKRSTRRAARGRYADDDGVPTRAATQLPAPATREGEHSCVLKEGNEVGGTQTQQQRGHRAAEYRRRTATRGGAKQQRGPKSGVCAALAGSCLGVPQKRGSLGAMRSGKKPRASSGAGTRLGARTPEGVRGKPAKHEAGVAEEERLAGGRPSARTVGQSTLEIVESKQASRNWDVFARPQESAAGPSACDAMRTVTRVGARVRVSVRTRLRSGGGECVRTER
ncbi:hypothetical protein ERJ75_001102200 [Trypanosoma vivax]|nr:hypothetical protein ERJ75_001102200 [Trypanosoma vivax]